MNSGDRDTGVSAIVFIGGAAPHPGVVARLPADRIVIAADSGFDHAHALGVHVDVLVGDLDSISVEGLAAAAVAGVKVERHPTAKDATDTELAIDAALERGARHIVVVSGGGDRFDHELGALAALTKPSYNGLDLEAWWGPAYLRVLHGRDACTIDGAPGALVSLIPMNGDAHGIRTIGLRYQLAAETLWAGSTRGISNEFVGVDAGVGVDEGTLLIIVPHALDIPREGPQ